MPDMTDEEAIVLEMERQEAATEQDLLDRIANAFDRADKGAEVEAVWPVVEAELALRAGQAEAELDALKAELAEQAQRTLNAVADKLYALPADGAALKGPYWFRKGFTDAADLLRDWADYPAALDHPTEERPMSELGFDAIKARANAATDAPWYVVGTPWNHDTPYVIAGNEDPHYGTFIADLLSITGDPDDPKANRSANAEFIAHAREDVPALVAEVERLTKDLAEMTSLRDNAVRAAEHADQSIDVDLDGLIGDGLAALGWEWDNEISDLAPPKLVDAIVDLVRPVIAHAVKRAGKAEAARDAATSQYQWQHHMAGQFHDRLERARRRHEALNLHDDTGPDLSCGMCHALGLTTPAEGASDGG